MPCRKVRRDAKQTLDIGRCVSVKQYSEHAALEGEFGALKSVIGLVV